MAPCSKNEDPKKKEEANLLLRSIHYSDSVIEYRVLGYRVHPGLSAVLSTL